MIRAISQLFVINCALFQVICLFWPIQCIAAPAASTCQSWQVLAAMQGQDLKLYYGHPGQSNSVPYLNLSAAFKETQPQARPGIPMLYLGSGYDGIHLIAQIAKLCGGGNRECLIRELSKVTNFVGANGPVSFDRQGNNTTWDQIEIRTVRNGDFVRY
jgi:ABC-type branched-subunit amino acid transport system substrate-binding protein